MGFLSLPSDPGKLKIPIQFVTIELKNIPITNSTGIFSTSRPAVKIGSLKNPTQVKEPVGQAGSRQTEKVTSKEFATVRTEVTKSAISEGQRLNGKPASLSGRRQIFLIHQDHKQPKQPSAHGRVAGY